MRCREKSGKRMKLGGIPTSSVFHVAQSIILTGLVCIFTDKIFNFIIVKSYKKLVKGVWA